MLLIERNVEIFEVAKFLTKKDDSNKVLSVLGSQDTGNYEIVVFAVNYCKERNTIHEAIYFDLSELKIQGMMDRLNILLALNVSASQTQDKYIQKIIEKINEKFLKNFLPVTLIFGNLNNNF